MTDPPPDLYSYQTEFICKITFYMYLIIYLIIPHLQKRKHICTCAVYRVVVPLKRRLYSRVTLINYPKYGTYLL